MRIPLPTNVARSRHRRRRSGPAEGFTLLELMVVIGLILATVIVGFPAFSRFIHQSRLRGFVQESTVMLARARTEAIQRGVPVVAVPYPDRREFFVYANVDDDADLQYQPNASAPARTVDYPLGAVHLPNASQVNFFAPEDNDPNGNNITVGLTQVGASGDKKSGFVFEPDGSVRNIGGMRIGDDRGNFFELRAEPRASGRVKVLKYNFDPSWGGSAGFFEAGNDPSSGKPLWVWY